MNEKIKKSNYHFNYEDIAKNFEKEYDSIFFSPSEANIQLTNATFSTKVFYYGIDVIENPHLTITELVRRKIHKKKRIDKKYAKKYGFKSITKPDDKIYVMPNNSIVAHPSIIHKIEDYIKNNKNVRYV